MRRSGPAFRRRRLSMTSLIDVIFLLLLFFMLSSTFSRFAEVELMTAQAGGAAQDSPPLFLRLEQEALSLNGAPIPLPDLPATILARKGGEAPVTVLVSLGPAVSAQRLVDLLAALRSQPGIAVHVLGAG